MNIAIIADDAKKELMVQFCIAYCGVLSRHNLFATGTTGKLVAEATGLDIVKFLSGNQGGSQQIASRSSCDEIDLLLLLSPMKRFCLIFVMCTTYPLPPTLPQQRCLFTVLSVATLTGVSWFAQTKLYLSLGGL